MDKIEMPHAGHDKHLCYLRNLGYPTTRPEDYKKLIRNGKFWCRNCGRIAAEARNLCNPESL